MANNTMRAWVFTSAPDGLEKSLFLSNNAPAPAQTPGAIGKTDIVVRVHAASINPVDHKLPEMTSALTPGFLASPPQAPTDPDAPCPSGVKSPGLDYAGVIAATGHNVDTFRVGQRVFGRCAPPVKFGTLGEYLTIDYQGCIALPDNISFEDGAAIGTTALTAYQSIKPYITPNSNQKIFINGGSGGTGTWGIQLGKALGCHVTTTCSTRNVALCKELGADEVIDYSTEDVIAKLTSQGQVFTLVVDNVGSSPANLYNAADNFLIPGKSRYVQVGSQANMASLKDTMSRALIPSFLGGGKSKYSLYMTKNSHDDMAAIAKFMVEGKCKAVIDEVFEWADAKEAFVKLKSQRARGNIVVKGAPETKA